MGGTGSCRPPCFLLQGVSLEPFLARGNAGLQTPSPLLSRGTGDLLLQVLQYSHMLESESGADSVPPQAPGERHNCHRAGAKLENPLCPRLYEREDNRVLAGRRKDKDAKMTGVGGWGRMDSSSNLSSGQEQDHVSEEAHAARQVDAVPPSPRLQHPALMTGEDGGPVW